jgi:hypothetical protein
MGLLSKAKKKIKKAYSNIEREVKEYTKDVLAPYEQIAQGNVREGMVGAFVDIYKRPIEYWQSGEVSSTAYAGMEAIGMESPDQKRAREAQEKLTAESNARAGALEEATKDRTLDEISRSEIMELYRKGASSSQLASILRAARAGEGVYGVRRINQNQSDARAAAPGRAQTVSSLGYGSFI